MTTVSVIVPYRYENDERARVYRWVLARWQALHPDWELLTPHDVADEGPFNRSRAVNRGVEMASSDVVIVADADIAVRHGQADEMAGRLAAGCGWVVGFDRMVHANEHISGLTLDQPPDAQLSPRFADNYIRWSSTGSVCGLVALNRDDYLHIGGNDERFSGWGWEDTSFAFKADTILGPHVRTDGDCVHLYHGLRADRKVDESARANAALGARYASANGDPDAMTLLAREAISA